ncbi:hypothetical protein SPRI_4153 [Streptomyces pristinaespiralis]|uniref:Uncharacterized protein n=1 Tax=Streptomyces pristinaespiralis TaxID=38300 RepID=A0A0M3QJ18_STRPR|nr:hypothetical protein SPRI_4153 [Streptomyces pristinaespiralis]
MPSAGIAGRHAVSPLRHHPTNPARTRGRAAETEGERPSRPGRSPRHTPGPWPGSRGRATEAARSPRVGEVVRRSAPPERNGRHGRGTPQPPSRPTPPGHTGTARPPPTEAQPTARPDRRSPAPAGAVARFPRAPRRGGPVAASGRGRPTFGTAGTERPSRPGNTAATKSSDTARPHRDSPAATHRGAADSPARPPVARARRGRGTSSTGLRSTRHRWPRSCPRRRSPRHKPTGLRPGTPHLDQVVRQALGPHRTGQRPPAAERGAPVGGGRLAPFPG